MSKACKKDSDYQIAKDIAETLIGKGVKLLALDFDQTLVSVHTKGNWHEGCTPLAQHVRPCFKHFIAAALDVGLYVCIVTYSTQPDLIQDVLKLALPKQDASKILVRASTKDWKRDQGLYALLLGKQQHLVTVCTDLYNKYHVIIQPSEILLLDDDEENVKVAKDFSHKGFVVKEDITLDILNSYVQNLE